MRIEEKIEYLQKRLDGLVQKQQDFSEEVKEIQRYIDVLKAGENPVEEKKEEKVEVKYDARPKPIPEMPTEEKETPKYERVEIGAPASNIPKLPKGKSDIEKFIGENLISKIGIAITVIGVAIGAKYAIDNELISPLTRIVLGYLFGAGLLGFAINLKKKYENYSAILLSGAMTIMYFITYSAYSFYALIPQSLTFGLMVVFTIFTVIASLSYNKQIIALIGMVGAYAVPFLLSDGSGNVMVLFSYMAIINIGILVIAFKKYWRMLYYSAFVMTWLIYGGWYATSYEDKKHFDIALLFLFIFFITFYIVFLSYKLVKKEMFKPQDVVLVLINSFIFYGFGYAILDSHSTTSEYLGLFTVFNAVIHFVVSLIVYQQKLADKNLFHLILGMVLVFITIAIPVQLDGNWVTLLWASEAVLLFWIGRSKKVAFYEALSYPVVFIAFFSLWEDWSNAYESYYEEVHLTSIFNITFFTSIFVLIVVGLILKMMNNEKLQSTIARVQKYQSFINFVLVAFFLFTMYMTFKFEIDNYFDGLYSSSALKTKNYGQETTVYNRSIEDYKTIWGINYTLLFASILALVSFTKIKNLILDRISLVLLLISILSFITLGLDVLGGLRYSYLNPEDSPYFEIGINSILIRYVSYIFIAIAVFVFSYCLKKVEIKNTWLNAVANALFYIFILWILSSELINLMELSHSTQSDKLGLSILWGVYAFLLIALGIWKKRRYLRIMAFVLFGITLLKLFFYDIAELDTISKTIVLVSLGVLLLVISFLYNKYRNIISDESKD